MTERLTTRNNHHRDLTTTGFHVRAESVDEQERSVEAVLSTDTIASVFDFSTYRMIDEILLPDGAEHGQQVPLLESHMRYSTGDVLGSIRNIRVEDGKLVGRLFFAEGDDAAEKAWNKVRQGHITDVSIGYRAIDGEYTDIKPNTTQRVYGKEYTAGERTLRITRRYKVKEGSLVAIGADEAAKIRSEQDPQPQQHERNVMGEQLRKYLESIGLRGDASDADAWAFYNALGGDQKARAEGIHNGTIRPAEPPAPVAQEPQQARSEQQSGAVQQAHQDESAIRAAERQRVDYCRSQQVEGVSDDLVQRAINEGWNEDRVAREYLQAFRNFQGEPVNSAPAIHTRSSDDFGSDTLAAALMIRSGVQLDTMARNDNERQRWERSFNDADRFAGLSMYEACREAVRMHDAKTPDGMHPHSPDEYIRAAFSTPTLSYAFTTSANAMLLESYMEEMVVLDFVETVSVNDFKQHEAIGVGKGAGLKKLPRGKTAKHATYADTQETYRVHRYAEQIVFDEQDAIDDGLNTFATMVREMGAEAARVAPDLIYYLLMSNPTLAQDNKALFHADHNNTDTNALSSANLKTGIAAVRNQTQNNVNLDLEPAFIITGPTLGWTAAELMNSSQIVIAGTAGSVTERGAANTLQGLLQVRTSSRIENGVTDPNTGSSASGSTTAWFLATRPRRTLRLAYLRGQSTPTVRRFDLTQGQYGYGFDIKLDVGAAAIGYQGLYRGNT